MSVVTFCSVLNKTKITHTNQIIVYMMTLEVMPLVLCLKCKGLAGVVKDFKSSRMHNCWQLCLPWTGNANVLETWHWLWEHKRLKFRIFAESNIVAWKYSKNLVSVSCHMSQKLCQLTGKWRFHGFGRCCVHKSLGYYLMEICPQNVMCVLSSCCPIEHKKLCRILYITQHVENFPQLILTRVSQSLW